MFSARDFDSKDIVYARTLITFDYKSRVFVCPGCGTTMIPVVPEKKAAHFRLKGNHDDRCDIDGTEKIVKKAKKTRLAQNELDLYAPMPYKLALKDTRVVTREDVDVDPELSGKERARSVSTGGSDAKGKTRRSTSAIYDIAVSFMDCPYNRDATLIIPGLEGRTYLSHFKKISKDKVESYQSKKVFYAQLGWAKVLTNDKRLVLTLNAGERKDGRVEKPYRLIVEWSDWSDRKKKILYEEIIVNQNASKSVDKKPGFDAWVFFIGEQDSNDLQIFRVEDSRLVCCIFARYLFVKY